MQRNGPGLAFLLSLGGLPVACAPENPPITGMSGSSGTTTTGMLGASDAGTSESTGAPPPPPMNAACVAYYKTVLKCFADETAAYAAYLAGFCDRRIDMGLAADGPLCAEAWAEGYVCVSELPCGILVHDDAPQCVAEFAAAEAACPTPVDDG